MAIEFNAEGRRIGESHPRARYADKEVELIQRLAEAGVASRALSSVLGVPYSTVRAFANGRMRCQVPSRWRREGE